MKKSKTPALAKKAKRALKKDLTDKIALQLKTVISDFAPEIKKAEKSIEKAAKNLAKKLVKLAKQPDSKLANRTTETTVAVETAPIKALPPSGLKRTKASAKSVSNKPTGDTETGS